MKDSARKSAERRGGSDDDKTLPPKFYDWRKHFPQLKILIDNMDILIDEMKVRSISFKNTTTLSFPPNTTLKRERQYPQSATSWQLWPEDLYNRSKGEEWRVFPFLHTFPAYDKSKMEWVGPNCEQCPKTVKLLKCLPGIRTALYSRMNSKMKLTPHQGWAALSNHVLRCHIAICIPEEKSSGVWCGGEKRFHKQSEILVFDDSQVHSGFNLSDKTRCVLIVDLLRPKDVPKGIATGKMTDKLQEYIDYFKGKSSSNGDVDEKSAASLFR